MSQRPEAKASAGPASPCEQRSASPYVPMTAPDLSLRTGQGPEAELLRSGGGNATRRLLVLEPYYGGSHKAVLDCLLPHLGWNHDLLHLPARK